MSSCERVSVVFARKCKECEGGCSYGEVAGAPQGDDLDGFFLADLGVPAVDPALEGV